MTSTKGDKELREAAEEADVIVAHLSSVPLVELRTLAGLNMVPRDSKPQLVTDYADLWEQAVTEASEPSEDDDLKDGLDEADFSSNRSSSAFASDPRRSSGGFTCRPSIPSRRRVRADSICT